MSDTSRFGLYSLRDIGDFFESRLHFLRFGEPRPTSTVASAILNQINSIDAQLALPETKSRPVYVGFVLELEREYFAKLLAAVNAETTFENVPKISKQVVSEMCEELAQVPTLKLAA